MQFKIASLLILASTATAFMPSALVSRAAVRARGRVQMSTNFADITQEAGISGPFGFFDPLGLSAGKTPGEMKKFREAELKHGRVAMLAVLGFITQEFFHPFFNLGGENLSPAVYQFQEVESRVPFLWELILFGVALVEGKTILKGWQSPEDVAPGTIAYLRDDYTPGDLGFDPLGLKPDNEQDFEVLQTKELNNGRLAMIAILALVVQEKISDLGVAAQLEKFF